MFFAANIAVEQEIIVAAIIIAIYSCTLSCKPTHIRSKPSSVFTLRHRLPIYRSAKLAHRQHLDIVQIFSDWLTYSVDNAKSLVPQSLWKMFGFYVITRYKMLLLYQTRSPLYCVVQVAYKNATAVAGRCSVWFESRAETLCFESRAETLGLRRRETLQCGCNLCRSPVVLPLAFPSEQFRRRPSACGREMGDLFYILNKSLPRRSSEALEGQLLLLCVQWSLLRCARSFRRCPGVFAVLIVPCM